MKENSKSLEASKSSKRPIVQRHHTSYDPERVVHVTKGEHLILTRMQWYTKALVSKGFLTALRAFLKEAAGRAIELKGEYNGDHK